MFPAILKRKVVCRVSGKGYYFYLSRVFVNFLPCRVCANRTVLPVAAPDDVVPQTDQDGHRDHQGGGKGCQRHEGTHKSDRSDNLSPSYGLDNSGKICMV